MHTTAVVEKPFGALFVIVERFGMKFGRTAWRDRGPVKAAFLLVWKNGRDLKLFVD